MTFSVTLRASRGSTALTQTNGNGLYPNPSTYTFDDGNAEDSPTSFTPNADSLLLGNLVAMLTGGELATDSSVTMDSAVTTEPATLVCKVEGTDMVPWYSTGAAWPIGGRVDRHSVGASPSSRTYTVRAAEDTGNSGFHMLGSVLDITGHDIANPVVQSVNLAQKEGEGNNETASVTLPAAPTPGNLLVVFIGVGNDGADGFGTVTAGSGNTFTTLMNGVGLWVSAYAGYRVVESGDSATVSIDDLGGLVGNSYMAVVEVAAPEITDDFEAYTDGQTLNAQTNWATAQIADSGVPTIDTHTDHKSGQVVDMSTVGQSIAVWQGGQVGSDDHYAEVAAFPDAGTIFGGAGNRGLGCSAGVFFRGQASSPNSASGYIAAWRTERSSTDTLESFVKLYRITSGTLTELDTTADIRSSYSMTVPHTLKASVEGSVITVTLDGNTELTYDTASDGTKYATGKYVGTYFAREQATTDHQPFLDDFKASGTGAPSGSDTPVSTSWSTSWDVEEVALTPVSAARSTSWNTQATAGTSHSTSWNAQTTAGTSHSTSWNAQTTASTSRSTAWDVLSTVSAQRSSTWNARATAGTSRSTSWNAQATVSAQRSTAWDVLSTVSAQRSSTWNAQATVSAQRSTSWDVEQQGAVSASRSTSWGVRETVLAGRSTLWNTKVTASKAVSTSWNDRATASRAVSTTWDVIRLGASVISTTSTSWNVVGRSLTTASTRWNALRTVSDTQTTSWHVLERVSALRGSSWDVLTSALDSMSTSWSVRAYATASRGTSWSVGSRVSRAVSTSWHMLYGLFTPTYMNAKAKIVSTRSSAKLSSPPPSRASIRRNAE